MDHKSDSYEKTGEVWVGDGGEVETSSSVDNNKITTS